MNKITLWPRLLIRWARMLLGKSYYYQLSALALVDQDPLWVEYRDRWALYQRKRWNKFKALGIKAVQKLKEPGESVIIQ